MDQPAQQFAVQWHRKTNDISDHLWQGALRPPAEQRWWYESLENGRLEGQFEFYYGELTAGGNAVGIVPAFVMNVPMDLVAPPEVMKIIRKLGPLGRPFLTQRTLFLGNVAGEGGDVGVASGVDEASAVIAVERAAWAFRKRVKAKLVIWKDFERSRSILKAGLLQSAGYFVIDSYPATEIPLSFAVTPAPSNDVARETYLKGLSQDYRYKLRKKLKSSQASVPLTTDILLSPSPEEMNEIWGLFQQTYQHGKTKFENFGPAVFGQFARNPGSRWLILRRADTRAMVAFMLLTREPEHWVNRFIGLDYAAPKELFLYYRLFVAAVEYCSQDPRPRLLSGQTGYRAKLELGHSLIPLDNYGRHRNPLMHWIYTKIANTVNWSTLDEELSVFLKAHPGMDGSLKRGEKRP